MKRPPIGVSVLLVGAAGCNILGGPDYFVDPNFEGTASATNASGVGGSPAGSSVASGVGGGAVATTASSGGAMCVPAECKKEDAANDCIYSACIDGTCDHMLSVPTNTPCSVQNGTFCDGNGACVECNDTSQCVAPATCELHHCKAPGCKDGLKNGTEADLDCGGDCPPCAAGQSCGKAGDCATNLCISGKCSFCSAVGGCESTPNSYCDSLLNGKCAPKLTSGSFCLLDAVCLSGKCVSFFCQ